jgi:hypothetical protein
VVVMNWSSYYDSAITPHGRAPPSRKASEKYRAYAAINSQIAAFCGLQPAGRVRHASSRGRLRHNKTRSSSVSKEFPVSLATASEHAAVGLPWAAFAGSFAARNLLGEADEDYKKYYRYFSNRRHFAFPSGLVKIIGKPLVFSLSKQLGEVLSGRSPPQAR